MMKRMFYTWMSVLLMAQMAVAQNFNGGDLERTLEVMADSLTRNLQPWDVSKCRVYRVEDFGAKADGITVNTVILLLKILRYAILLHGCRTILPVVM